MKKKPSKATKKHTITVDKIKEIYFRNYGYRIINFSDQFLNLIKDLGITIKDK